MRKITYYCDYCQQETVGDPRGLPCTDCIALLKRAIHERRTMNEFRIFGQIWKVPIGRGFSLAAACGEGRYVARMMKRLARKAPSYAS